MDDLNLLTFGIKEVETYRSVEELIRIFHAQGALFGYAHPVKKRTVPNWLMEIIEGFEVWNTRHDGKLTPRRSNVGLFQDFLQKNPKIRPLVGLDFHKPSDYAEAFLRVECDDHADILEAIRAGKYSLRANDRDLQVYPGPGSRGSWTSALKASTYTCLYDSAVALHRWLSRCGVPVPKNLKTALKRIF